MSLDQWFCLILVRLSLALQTLWRYMPNDHLSILIRLNLHSFFRQSEHGCLDRRHIVPPLPSVSTTSPYRPVVDLRSQVLRPHVALSPAAAALGRPGGTRL